MKHYGDITKLSGYDLPVVDIITGGSPCQDLSVAGKRAGLAGERSGLFMEQMRIIREMREKDARDTGRTGWAVRPRYMVWENVPGAFSRGKPKGADFAAVIEEIIKVAEPGAVVDVCVPERGWTKSGCYYAEDGSWSIAWRVHDAQFWGVPQRRKRIALVADFGGLSAPEILFERKGLRGDSEPSGTEREGAAGGAEGGAGSAISFQERAGKPGGGKGILIQREHVGALSTLNNQSVYSIGSFNSEGMKSENPGAGIYETDTVRTLDLTGGNPACYQGGIAVVFENHSQDSRYNPLGDTRETVSAKYGTGGNNMPMVVEPTTYQKTSGCLSPGAHPGSYNGQDAYNDMLVIAPIITFDKEMYNCGEKMGGVPQARYDTVAPTVRADSHPSGVCTSTVRRLTPIECERLQGYPDGWTDIGEWVDSKGKRHKEADSPRYKALGNSIALPFWAWLARRICAQYERPMTMASLFDGIGGFPLVFSRAGAIPVWASEIEEFPIAVTKIHFPEVEE